MKTADLRGGTQDFKPDGDGRRIFVGLKFSFPVFLVEKFSKYFFGRLDLTGGFLGVPNNLNIRVEKAKMFLGVSIAVKMITRCGKITSDGMINKQTETFNF